MGRMRKTVARIELMQADCGISAQNSDCALPPASPILVPFASSQYASQIKRQNKNKSMAETLSAVSSLTPGSKFFVTSCASHVA